MKLSEIKEIIIENQKNSEISSYSREDFREFIEESEYLENLKNLHIIPEDFEELSELNIENPMILDFFLWNGNYSEKKKDYFRKNLKIQII